MTPEEEVHEKVLEAVFDTNLEQDKKLRSARRWQVFDRVLSILALIFLLYLALNNRAALTEIRSQTSPAVQERQQKVLKQTVLQIDCNGRLALQDVIEGLVKQGVLEPGQVVVTCERTG